MWAHARKMEIRNLGDISVQLAEFKWHAHLRTAIKKAKKTMRITNKACLNKCFNPTNFNTTIVQTLTSITSFHQSSKQHLRDPLLGTKEQHSGETTSSNTVTES